MREIDLSGGHPVEQSFLLERTPVLEGRIVRSGAIADARLSVSVTVGTPCPSRAVRSLVTAERIIGLEDRCTLTKLPTGPVTLNVHHIGQKQTLYSKSIYLRPADRRSITVSLGTPPSIRGVVVGPDGPLRRVQVAAYADEYAWSEGRAVALRTLTGADGSFVLEAAEDRPYRLLCFAAPRSFPVAIRRNVRPSPDSVRIRIGATRMGSIRARIEDAESNGIVGISLLQLPDGHDRPFSLCDGLLEVDELPAGRYEIIALDSDSDPVVSFGVHSVTAGAPLHLGDLRSGEPGTMNLTSDLGPDAPFELHSEAGTFLRQVSAGEKISLLPGSYALRHSMEPLARRIPVHVRSGKPTRVRHVSQTGARLVRLAFSLPADLGGRGTGRPLLVTVRALTGEVLWTGHTGLHRDSAYRLELRLLPKAYRVRANTACGRRADTVIETGSNPLLIRLH